jgi:hypothetical protein
MAPPLSASDWELLQGTLEALGEAVLATFHEIRGARSAESLATVRHEVAADLIYTLDHAVEERLLAWIEQHWPTRWPVRLVMEGLEDAPCLPTRAGSSAPPLTLVIDPLDGTREIMWDRRPAWFLAALAPSRDDGLPPRLAEVETAAMVELPPTRHRGSHCLSVRRGGPVRARQRVFSSGACEPVHLAPYAEESLAHGFVTLGTPFYQGKARMSAFAEAFLARYFAAPLHSLPIFDDQYISTGGQLFDLMTGRLRLFSDLRPLFLEGGEGRPPLVCHPYDICTALIAESLGCVIESPQGEPLEIALDTDSPVALMAYANERIAARARPIVRDLLPLLAAGESPRGQA